MADSNIKLFSPEIESASEFLERWEVQNYTQIVEFEKDAKSKAMLLANSLPTDVLTDIQRK